MNEKTIYSLYMDYFGEPYVASNRMTQFDKRVREIAIIDNNNIEILDEKYDNERFKNWLSNQNKKHSL